MQKKRLLNNFYQSKTKTRHSGRNKVGFRFFLRKISRYTKLIIFFIILSALAVLAYMALFRSSYFKINDIKVNGAKSFVNATDLTEIVRGKVWNISIVKVNSRELEENLLETFQGAKDIKVFKVYPRKISVEVTERVPLAVVYKNVKDVYYLVDEAGYVLGQVEPEKTNLPKIHYDGQIQVGYFLDQNMVPVYLELMDAINSEDVNVSSISFSSENVTLFVQGGTEVLLKNNSNKFETVKLVSSLLKQLILEGKIVKKIDLRFDKVIVSYE